MHIYHAWYMNACALLRAPLRNNLKNILQIKKNSGSFSENFRFCRSLTFACPTLLTMISSFGRACARMMHDTHNNFFGNNGKPADCCNMDGRPFFLMQFFRKLHYILSKVSILCKTGGNYLFVFNICLHPPRILSAAWESTWSG